MKSVADVSIISANYNNAPFLRQFMQSILENSMLPRELIVVDDGSVDESVNILKSFAHHAFVKLVFLPSNKGFTNALNIALETASSRYIMRADPDDLFLPDRIETQYTYLENHPDVDVLGSNAIYFENSFGKTLNRSNFPLGSENILNTFSKGEQGVLHATVCARADVYKRYRYQPLSPGEDYELFARMARDGVRFANLKQPLYKIRVHAYSSTSRLSFSAMERTFRFRDQIFGTNTSRLHIWRYYWHIKSYRKSQLADNLLLKGMWLAVSIILYPVKLYKRLIE